MTRTVKEVKVSLLKKRKRNVFLGVVMLAIAIVLGATVAKNSVLAIIATIVVSLLAALFFFLAFLKHREYKKLVESTKPVIYFFGEGKDVSFVRPSSQEYEEHKCDCENCDGSCNCGKK